MLIKSGSYQKIELEIYKFIMNVGIIPCDNGFGHISRSIQLANILIKKFRVTLFISKNIKNFSINKKISIKKIDANFKIIKNSGYNINWYKKIKKKKFDRIDFLISDNLPEAIFFNKKTIIYANFFWHEIFNKDKRFIKNLRKKIIEKNVKIFSNYLFGNISPIKKNIHKIGFIGKYKNQNIQKKRGILISLGNSRIGYKNNFQISLRLFNNPKYKKYIFYIDKSLFKKEKRFPKNIKIANFSDKMFEDIKIAIIKPGFGTIQDCLKRGIAINSYLQKHNKEFLNNAKILKNKKIGSYFFNFNSALNSAINKFDNNKKIFEIQKICKKLNWNGERYFHRYISKKIVNL